MAAPTGVIPDLALEWWLGDYAPTSAVMIIRWLAY